MRGYATISGLLQEAHTNKSPECRKAFKVMLEEAKVTVRPTLGKGKVRWYKKDEAIPVVKQYIDKLRANSKTPYLVGRAMPRKWSRSPKGAESAGVRASFTANMSTPETPSGVLFTIQYGKNKSVTLTVAEANQIYKWLSDLYRAMGASALK